jgi:hypothetical protein
MVNSDYCFVLNQLRTASSLRTGDNPAGLGTKAPLQAAKATLDNLPSRVR